MTKQDPFAALDSAVAKSNPPPAPPAPAPAKPARRARSTTNKYIGVYMPEELHHALRVVAFKTDRNVSSVICEAISSYFEQHPGITKPPKELR